MSTPQAKLRLLHVEIEGFRAVNSPVQLDFDERATLLFAPNGQGKTSLLAAIEWCLFGKLAYQISENLTNDEIVNMHHRAGEAYVRIVLQRGQDHVTVERRRRVGKREMTLRVTLDGKTTENPAADNMLFRILGLTFDDFYRAAFLHQESVRGLLVEEPRVRNEAFDRLFGLDKLRDILAAIQIRPVTEAIEEIQGKQRRAFDKLSGAAQQLELQRNRHLQEAMTLGLVESGLTLADGQRLAARILAELADVCLKGGLHSPEIGQPQTADDLERVARRVKEAIRDCRLSTTAEPSAATVSRKLAEIEAAKLKVETAARTTTRAAEELASHEQANGSDEVMDRLKVDLESKRNEVRGAIAALDATTRLLGDAIEVIRTDPTMTACPVCGQQVRASGVIESLDSRLRGVQRTEHDRRVAELNQIRGDLDALGLAAEERLRLRRAYVDASKHYDEVLADARRLMPELPVGEQTASFIEAELNSTRDQLDQVTLLHSAREQALNDLDQSVDRLRALQKVVKDDEDSAHLAGKSAAESDGPDGNALNEELERLSDLQEALRTIARAVQDVATVRAGEAIESSRSSTADYYNVLCDHPYFDRLRIDALEKTVAGVAKNNYVVRAFSTSDGRDTLAGSRLSTAQMNCVALSIYLALAGVLTHNLGFIILDDPSQNLDSSHKRALASVLKRIASSTQLVVSTQDSELERSLLESLGKEGIMTYRLTWTPQQGTLARRP